ncbi:MAG: ATP synthase F0 subunit B, partial [Candidatus Aminicenantes bacterium]|nr:ATP synthase F0 subunit B [Candidatus Aminicenantes bacterium]
MLRRKSAVFLSLLVVFALQTATASSGEEHGGELMDYLGKTVNFLLLFGGLAFVLARPVRNFLQELILSVEKTMTETEKARKEAERELEKIRKRLDGLAAEVQRIKEEGEAAGIKEKERILALARQEAE